MVEEPGTLANLLSLLELGVELFFPVGLAFGAFLLLGEFGFFHVALERQRTHNNALKRDWGVDDYALLLGGP